MYTEQLKLLQNYILSNKDSVSYYNWMYEDGVLLKALIRADEILPDNNTYPYIKDYVDNFVDDNGKIEKIASRPPSADSLNNGKIIVEIYKKFGDEKYYKALSYIYNRIKEHPKLSGTDAFAHKAIYKDQMWLDGLYMLQPLYAQLITIFNEPHLYSHVAKQFEYIDKFTYDNNKKLFYHAYDHSRNMFWCNKENGHSPSFWGRAIGWLAMAVIDTYELIPEYFAKERTIIKNIAEKIADGIIRYQNKNGVWYQIVDKEHAEGNYEEASCSCMFTYFLKRGVNISILPSEYNTYANRAITGIFNKFVNQNTDGSLHINNICLVAGLGPDKKPHRDGSFSYYINEPIVSDDNKALGPLMLALCEF